MVGLSSTAAAGQFLRSEEGDKEQDDDVPDVVINLGILSQNINAVEVFRTCKWDMASGMGGVELIGISSTEIMGRCELRGLPRSEWSDVADRIKVLQDETIKQLRRKREQAERNRKNKDRT